MKPTVLPKRPEFSSGPCAKPPGWSAAALEKKAWLGRSHRARGPKAQIQELLARMRALLELPDSYLLALTPGSDTGAFEMALWSLLGPRPVDVLVWENFGQHWLADIRDHMAIADLRLLEADYGSLPKIFEPHRSPDLVELRIHADVVFVWNGTTSGVRLPSAGFIYEERGGLTICDATSAVFAQQIDWHLIDVATFSWQKVLGGEAAHGMLVLSPRAVERLEKEPPPRPLPKVFRLTKNGALDRKLFEGDTINTVSMLCIADCLLALDWAEEQGGAPALRRRADGNFQIVQDWIDGIDWGVNMAVDPATRSNTSVCIRLTEEWFVALEEDRRREVLARMARLLEDEGAAYDIVNHRAAPASLRIWCGATVEADDLKALTPWIDWAYGRVREEYGQ